ncbi:MAG: hypothetical protein RR929_01550 [Erysipelotrichaceae bacterium]
MKKKNKKVAKKVKSTLDWIQIDKINKYHIDLKKGKKEEVAVGIKIQPHSLFLDSPSEQAKRIHMLRSALNRLNFDIYHSFVFNPVNLDAHLLSLSKQLVNENDEVIKEMLEDDIEKSRAFIDCFRELEFFMMIKGKPSKKFDDQYHQLQYSIKASGFSIDILNEIDFDNLISNQFENQIINDMYFTRGIFSDEINNMDMMSMLSKEGEDNV